MFFDENVYDEFTSQSMSIIEFKRRMDDETLIIPKFQRNTVWNNKLKQKYLDTISKKGPLFGFVLNWNKDKNVYELIDGQNRGKTICGFMDDEFKYKNNESECGINYSDITGSEKRMFDNLEIHFIKTFNWSHESCINYFRTIQEGMKLTDGEQIHSADNNIFSIKINDLYKEYEKYFNTNNKNGGFQYGKNKRYKAHEIIGGLLKIFMDNKYYDRPGKISLDELNRFDMDDYASDKKDILENSVHTFKLVFNYLISIKDKSENLKQLKYSRDSTFMRCMYFIFKNIEYKSDLTDESIQKFDTMIGVVLNKETPLYDYIQIQSTRHGIENIMKEYIRVYNEPESTFQS
jgi:hypothetical protein